MTPDIIAIDGPAASGKSSVSRLLAATIGLRYVNSGSFYRSVTHAVIQAGVDPRDAAAMEAFLETLRLETRSDAGGSTALYINGTAATDAELRDPAVNGGVSAVASHPAVRDRLTTLLRALAADGPLVMEGRDIGSVVFPDSRCKFYIDASEEVRASRRAAQGEDDSIAARDAQDSSRQHAPLVVSGDASLIDSSHLTLQGVVDEIISRLQAKGFRVSL